MSLRARLLLGLIALTAAGLITAGVITYAAERSFLVSRVDQVFAGNAARSFEDYSDQQLRLQKPPPHGGDGDDNQLFPLPNGRPNPEGGPFGVDTRPPVGSFGIYTSASGAQQIQ